MYGLIKSLYVEFRTQNHEICLNDPLQEEFQVSHVWVDLFLTLLFSFTVFKTYPRVRVCDMSFTKNPTLRIVRGIGALGGCTYILWSFYTEDCTIVRFVMSRPRFLTDSFMIYFTLYYVSVFTWETVFGRSISTKFFSVWFSSLLFWNSTCYLCLLDCFCSIHVLR